MLQIYLLLSIFPIVFSCISSCDAACSAFNGKASCYTTCGCPPRPQKSITESLKSDLSSILKLKYVCYIEDEQKCENQSKTEEEFYKCLEDVNCLIFQNPPKMLLELPSNLWLAVQPHSFAKEFKTGKNCESCKEEVLTDNYHSCLFYHCQNKLKDGFLAGLLKGPSCAKCYNKEIENQSLCLWIECRAELVGQNELLEDGATNMTCKDCEKIVFADDYYNCISIYCNSLYDRDQLKKVSLESRKTCEFCKDLDGDLYDVCAKYSCADDMVPWAVKDLRLSQIKENKGELLYENAGYTDYIWLIVGAFGLMMIIFSLSLQRVFKKYFQGTEDIKYILLVRK